MLSLEKFNVCRLVKAEVKITRAEKFNKVMKQCIQACFSLVLMFYTTLGGPSWFLPLVRQKDFEGFLFLLLFTSLETQPGFY